MTRFEVPEGWVMQAYRFALDPTPVQQRAFRSHAGAARKAHNTMLAVVKAVMDQRSAERSYGIPESGLTPSVNWTLAGLRKQWNRRKAEAAPWWAENSKEAYNTGLDALARGLDATGRWHVSFQATVARDAENRARAVIGVDVGVKADSLLVIATGDGRELARVPAPKSLTAAQDRLCALQRRAARRTGPYDSDTKTRRLPSKRWRATQARIARTHAHAAAVRRDVLHKATTDLARRHRVIVVETLNAAGMRAGGGARKRGLNRALADAALAEIRRMLGYKTRWYGSVLVEADRYFPSSKTCSCCGRRKPNLSLADRTYMCDHCGLVIDRDLNAAVNLARLGGTGTGSGPAASHRAGHGRGARQETATTTVVNAAGDEASTRHNHAVGQTGTATPQGAAA